MDALHFQGCLHRVGDAPLVSSSSRVRLFRRISLPSRSSVSISFSASQSQSQSQQHQQPEEVRIPHKLKEIVTLFESVADPRARYEQLMFYAKRLPPLAEEFHSRENKVDGCVSQVWVRVYLDGDGRLQLEADSDSVLTKGLAALLVEGLSGSTPAEVVGLDPSFIQMLGLKQSLTPARNNGFYNMLGLIRKKTLELQMNSSSSSSTPSTSDAGAAEKAGDAAAAAAEVEIRSAVGGDGTSDLGNRGMMIRKKLEEALSPTVLEVEDVSYQHAGHAGVRGVSGGETHFNLKVVSSEFEGRSLVKRHRLVYDLLRDELNSGLHALSIVAKTPSELPKSG